MKRTWLFVTNTFESNTKGTQTKALRLFRDFHSKLHAQVATDPDIAAIFADFDGVYQQYEAMYAQKDAISGTYKGRTLNFEQTLSQLPALLRKWEGQVHFYFPEDSPEETELFPQRRTPFLSGSYDDRISAINSFLINLGNYSQLAGLQASVQSYYNTLVAARDVQQQKEGLNDQLSSLLEQQRVIVAQEMLGAYGKLLHKFRQNPELVLDFIEVELLRSKAGTGTLAVFKGKVTDVGGVPIAGAQVSLPEIAIETTTDATGNFEVELESGTWRVEVAAPGYQTHIQNGLLFAENATLEMNFQLAV